MKNPSPLAKTKILSKYLFQDTNYYKNKSTDINVLLNRVKQGKKLENRKKLLFSAITSACVLLFGVLVF